MGLNKSIKCECLEIKGNEEKKINHQKLEKLNETKDGLDVYELKSLRLGFECPICGKISDNKQLEEMKNQKDLRDFPGINIGVRDFNYDCKYNKK